MPVPFSFDQWDKIKEDYSRWWAGELTRPLIQVVLHGREPGRKAPALPFHWFTAFYDLDIPAEDVVDRWDYELSCCEYLGDGFPHALPNFGPGVVAAFLGAHVENGKDTVWFFPEKDEEIEDIRFQLEPDNCWLARVKDICRAANERWEGLVQIGMTDLGGNLDILSAFRPGEKLLLDLYDHPDAVKDVTWDAHEMWWRAFDEINEVLQPVNPGYTAWTPIYSEEPYYILQCDFCYMIGPDMFDEFVKPELAASCRRLKNAFYHLDGPGQLPHLDSLLEIDELRGVQWVPGAGQPAPVEWPGVYRKIRDAGKLIQLWGGLEELNRMVEHLGSSEGIIMLTSAGISEQNEVESFLKEYGAL